MTEIGHFPSELHLLPYFQSDADRPVHVRVDHLDTSMRYLALLAQIQGELLQHSPVPANNVGVHKSM